MDRYSKAVLTVIDVAQVVIGFRLSVPSAQAQFAASCEHTTFDPCYVRGSVTVENYNQFPKP